MGSLRRKVALFSILFILIALPVWATDYYVRPSGGDYGNEDGTSYYNAWDGFSNVNWATVDAGNGKLFVAGTHRESMTPGADGEASSPLYISSCETKYGASFNDPGILFGSVSYDITWSASDLGANRYKTADDSFETGVDVGMVYYNTNTSTTSYCTKVDTSGELNANHEFWYDTVDDCVHVFSNLGEPSAIWDGIEIPSDEIGSLMITINDYDYVTVEGLTIQYFNGHGIHGKNLSNLVARNNIVRFGGGKYNDDLSARLGNGITIDNSDTDVSFINNAVYQIFDACLGVETFWDDQVETIDGVTISGNTLSNCNWGVNVITDSLDATADSITNVTMSGNRIYNSGSVFNLTRNTSAHHGTGILCANPNSGSSMTNIIMEDNIVQGSVQNGIKFYQTDSGLSIRRNIITDSSKSGIWIEENTSTSDILGNIIYNNLENGIFLLNVNGINVFGNTVNSNGDYNSFEAALRLDTYCDDVTSKNNIFYSNTANSQGGTRVLFVSSTQNEHPTFDYNLYWSNTSDFIFYGYGAGLGAYNTSEWTTYKSDKSPADANSPTPTNPDFGDTSTGNYRLTSDSTGAINQGTDLGDTYTYAFDFRDTSFPYSTLNQDDYGNTWEIGAFVYSPYIKGIVTDSKGKPIIGTSAYVTVYALTGSTTTTRVDGLTYLYQTTTDTSSGEYWLLNLVNSTEYFVVESIYPYYRGKTKWSGAKFLTATSQ